MIPYQSLDKNVGSSILSLKSCGWAVPNYDFISHRPTLNNFNGKCEARAQQEKMSLRSLWKEWNTKSLDGLPGLTTALETDKPFVNNWKGLDVSQFKKKNKFKGEAWEMNEAGDMGTTEALKLRSRYLFDVRLYVGFVIGICFATAVRNLQHMIPV